MAPSSTNTPQRLRQRNAEILETTVISQKHWDSLLTRRKKCKEQYQNIKKEIDAATESLQNYDRHKSLNSSISTTEENARKFKEVFRIGPNSFINNPGDINPSSFRSKSRTRESLSNAGNKSVDEPINLLSIRSKSRTRESSLSNADNKPRDEPKNHLSIRSKSKESLNNTGKIFI